MLFSFMFDVQDFFFVPSAIPYPEGPKNPFGEGQFSLVCEGIKMGIFKGRKKNNVK